MIVVLITTIGQVQIPELIESLYELKATINVWIDLFYYLLEKGQPATIQLFPHDLVIQRVNF